MHFNIDSVFYSFLYKLGYESYIHQELLLLLKHLHVSNTQQNQF